MCWLCYVLPPLTIDFEHFIHLLLFDLYQWSIIRITIGYRLVLFLFIVMEKNNWVKVMTALYICQKESCRHVICQ